MNTFYITEEQWATLVAGGSITIEGVEYSYDSKNMYCVKTEPVQTTVLYKHTLSDATSGYKYKFITDNSTSITWNSEGYYSVKPNIISITVFNGPAVEYYNCLFNDHGMSTENSIHVDKVNYINGTTITSLTLPGNMTDTVTKL